RTLRADAVVTAGGMLGSTFLAGLTSILITRGLTVSERGSWGVVAATTTLAATIGSLGLPAAAAYGVARAEPGARGDLVRAAVAAVAGLVATLFSWGILAISRPGSVETWVLAVGGCLAGLLLVQQVTQQLTLTGLSTFWFALCGAVPAAAALIAVTALTVQGG